MGKKVNLQGTPPFRINGESVPVGDLVEAMENLIPCYNSIMTEIEIFKWAKKNDFIPSDIFTKVTKVGEIDEGEVYELDSDEKNDEPLIIGLPSFIIVNGDKIKNVYGEEAFKVMDKLYPEDGRKS